MLLRFLTIKCDGFRCQARSMPFDMNLLDGAQARLRLKAVGWLNHGKLDLCPSCAVKKPKGGK